MSIVWKPLIGKVVATYFPLEKKEEDAADEIKALNDQKVSHREKIN